MMNLTKTDFLAGHQCTKALWLRRHGVRVGVLPDEASASARFLVDQGRAVGKLAQQRFPGGVNLLEAVGFDMARRAVETRRLAAGGADVLYEAVLGHGGAVCAVDIMVRAGGGWRIHEVKSGTSVEDHHVLDAAFQYWLLTHAGLSVSDISITHVNNQYLRQGSLDLGQLFSDVSVLPQAQGMQDAVDAEVASLQRVLEQDDLPAVSIGPHCSDPRDCPFRGHCWRHVPEYSVFNLARGGGKCWDLYGRGVLTIRDIPDDYKLTAAQKTQVAAEKSGQTVLDRAKVRRFLASLRYPLAHVDFETVAAPVPEFDGMRPYQQLPFQWSMHRQEAAGGEVTHREFLADADGDPREPFVTSLLEAVAGTESVLVFNRTFEDGRLAELQDRFPQLADKIHGVRARLVDLMTPFQRHWYYTPQMRGSYSIKAVLPALVPELSYAGLDIADGATASSAFVGLKGETCPEKVAEVRRRLLAYCCTDTWAMVRLLAKLYEA